MSKIKNTIQKSKKQSNPVIIFDLGGTLKVAGVLEIFPETKDVLRALSKKYRLFIGANQPVYAHQFLKEFNLGKYFEKVYISVEIGYKKPDLRFFQYILDDLKIKPENAIMVGDRYDNDVLPARSLGIKTIWINHLQEDGESDFTVQNLRDILEIL